jgi:c-di-GMP-binding flagellar brake protein YcgR
MQHFYEDKKRRAYKRSEYLTGKVYISKDEKKRHEVRVNNISAGGASLIIQENIAIDEKEEFYIKIEIMSTISKFDFKAKAKIVRKEGEHTYAVKFVNLKQSDQVTLAELINFNNKQMMTDID